MSQAAADIIDLDYTISSRARYVWRKFADWYGAREIINRFGKWPPQEWCEEIDSISSRDAVARVLSEVRTRHPTFPPRFPEFESIVRRFGRTQVQRGKLVQERLVEYVLKHKALTPRQLRGPWTFTGTGDPSSGDDFQITSVIVPSDGEQPGYRVCVADLALDDSV